LTRFRERIEQTYQHLLDEVGVVSAELLKNTLNGVNSAPEYILEAGEAERERLRERSAEINSTSTYRQSKTTQLNLKEFIEGRGMKDIKFKDITLEFGESFKLFLKRDKKYAATHINHCITWLNRLIYIAVDQEILRVNPLEDLEYEKQDRNKQKYITREELQRIMELPLGDKMGELARRMFIFSSFTALAYVDMQKLYPHHIGKTSESEKYIRICRAKSDVESFIPLHPIAEQILDLYNLEDDSQPIFPTKNRDMIWREINQIGYIVGIKHNLSYHQSRHSCATLMLSAGIPIESVSKMMGHTNIQSTQVYAKVTEDKISAEMDRLMERRKQNN
ncbi:MAG: site-specific integrase, partial [Rikenellaceae bacterium]